MIKLIILSLITFCSFNVSAHGGHEHGNFEAFLSHCLWLFPAVIAIFILYKIVINKNNIRVSQHQKNNK